MKKSWKTSVYATEIIPPIKVYPTEMAALTTTEVVLSILSMTLTQKKFNCFLVIPFWLLRDNLLNSAINLFPFFDNHS